MSGSRLRLGIFGGTFDPIHIGHLAVAEEARVVLCLDEVLFLPAGQPWFKEGQEVSDATHRIAMVELAIASNPYFRASDMEISRPGPTYTLDTLRELRREVGPGAEMDLLLGLDALSELDRWHLPDQVLDMATVIGIRRPGFEGFDAAKLAALSPDGSAEVTMLPGPMMDISGLELRRRVSQGRSIRYLVPGDVEAYINEHGLYR